uniref:Uncharacterized protein n=1 Tax=Glossina brevipalpis TaxID=37001 RepID=A0A1A9W202_9MUSC
MRSKVHFQTYGCTYSYTPIYSKLFRICTSVANGESGTDRIDRSFIHQQSSSLSSSVDDEAALRTTNGPANNENKNNKTKNIEKSIFISEIPENATQSLIRILDTYDLNAKLLLVTNFAIIIYHSVGLSAITDGEPAIQLTSQLARAD